MRNAHSRCEQRLLVHRTVNTDASEARDGERADGEEVEPSAARRPGPVHVGSTSFSSSYRHQSTAALLTNKNRRPQYRAVLVHIHSPHVLFLSRQGILCHFHFKAGEERQRHFFIITGL